MLDGHIELNLLLVCDNVKDEFEEIGICCKFEDSVWQSGAFNILKHRIPLNKKSMAIYQHN